MSLDGALVVLLMELASSFISFIVGYYALKGYRASGSRGLLMIYMGFLVLGIGIFLRIIAATISRSYWGFINSRRVSC